MQQPGAGVGSFLGPDPQDVRPGAGGSGMPPGAAAAPPTQGAWGGGQPVQGGAMQGGQDWQSSQIQMQMQQQQIPTQLNPQLPPTQQLNPQQQQQPQYDWQSSQMQMQMRQPQQQPPTTQLNPQQPQSALQSGGMQQQGGAYGSYGPSQVLASNYPQGPGGAVATSGYGGNVHSGGACSSRQQSPHPQNDRGGARPQSPDTAARARSPDAAAADDWRLGLQPIGGAGLRQRGAAERALARAEAEVTSFRMVLNGEIESAELGFSGRGPLMCVFSMQHGPDWSLVSGAPNGITQLACTSVPSSSSTASAFLQGGKVREVVWNFPIGLVYKSTSPFGWPRIVVSVYGTDLCNRRIIKGYGSAHVPCQPGRHKRTIRLYCPLSSSPLTRLLGALFGNPAQLVDPRLVAGTEGREVVRTQSNGKVQVSFDVLLKDTEPFNYTF